MRILIVFLLGAACVFWMVGCGEGGGAGFCADFPADPLCHDSSVQISGGNVCDQALQVLYAGFDAGCAGLGECCFCQCWNTGQQIPAQTDGCACEPIPQNSGPCEGESLDQANQCLDDKVACQQQATAMVLQYYCAQ